MIGWIVTYFISKEANIVLRIYKIQMRLHIENCTLAWSQVSRHRNERVILNWRTCKKSDINNKKNEILQLLGKIGEIWINYVTRKKNVRSSNENMENNLWNF